MSFNVDPGICWLFNGRPSYSQNAMLSMSVLIKIQKVFQVVKLILMVLCSIMLMQSVVLVYLVLPMLLTDQSHVLCAQYEFNTIMTDIRLIMSFFSLFVMLFFLINDKLVSSGTIEECLYLSIFL